MEKSPPYQLRMSAVREPFRGETRLDYRLLSKKDFLRFRPSVLQVSAILLRLVEVSELFTECSSMYVSMLVSACRCRVNSYQWTDRHYLDFLSFSTDGLKGAVYENYHSLCLAVLLTCQPGRNLVRMTCLWTSTPMGELLEVDTASSLHYTVYTSMIHIARWRICQVIKKKT